MIRTTVGKIAKDLEQLTSSKMPVGAAFEILSRQAESVEELVVVEVMKESYQEMRCGRERLSA